MKDEDITWTACDPESCFEPTDRSQRLLYEGRPCRLYRSEVIQFRYETDPLPVSRPGEPIRIYEYVPQPYPDGVVLDIMDGKALDAILEKCTPA